MKEPGVNLNLRNYLVKNEVPLAFINFKKSLIVDNYDGRGYHKDYQILVLEKPDPAAFEIESLKWTYSAERVLLIYNCSLKEVCLIPLEFSLKLPGRDKESQFNFCQYHALKICENHILMTTIGREIDSDHQCLDIALFKTDGKLVSVWKAENYNSYKSTIYDFHQLQPGHWIANLRFNRRVQHEPAVHRLCFLSLNRVKANSLSLKEQFNPGVGTLLASKTENISSWFGQEIEGSPHFFVLASHYQCCVYRCPKFNESNYEKIADIILENSFIDDVDNVIQTDDGITINFKNGRTLVESGSFHFSFQK